MMSMSLGDSSNILVSYIHAGHVRRPWATLKHTNGHNLRFHRTISKGWLLFISRILQICQYPVQTGVVHSQTRISWLDCPSNCSIFSCTCDTRLPVALLVIVNTAPATWAVPRFPGFYPFCLSQDGASLMDGDSWVWARRMVTNLHRVYHTWLLSRVNDLGGSGGSELLWWKCLGIPAYIWTVMYIFYGCKVPVYSIICCMYEILHKGFNNHLL